MRWQDPRLVSVTPFLPHSFETLQQNRHIRTETTHTQWASVVKKFETVTDVSIERISYLSDGLTVTGAMLLPLAPIAAAHPIVIYNRGGSGQFGILTASQMIALSHYARAGYIVFASNYRGNDGGEGRDEFGGGDVDDVLTLLDMAKQHPAWDGKNIYMYGHSRGGMMTLLAIKHGAKLNAAVSVAGPTVLTQLETDRPEMISIYERLIPDFKTNPQETLAARSAVTWADRLNTPLLILHGDADERVNVSHAYALDAALTKASKPHTMIIYPNGNHDLTGYRIPAREETMLWFETYKKT